MLIAKCTGKLRDGSKIRAYCLQDEFGRRSTMRPDELKALIKSRKMQVINLTLTSDNRLISRKSQDNAMKTPNTNKWFLSVILKLTSLHSCTEIADNEYEIDQVGGNITGRSLAFKLLVGPKDDYFSSTCYAAEDYIHDYPLRFNITCDPKTRTIVVALGAKGFTLNQYKFSMQIHDVNDRNTILTLRNNMNRLRDKYLEDDYKFSQTVTQEYFDSITAEKIKVRASEANVKKGDTSNADTRTIADIFGQQ